MRWTETEHNAKRVVTFFAILPVYCEEDKKKNRWLEMVTIEQRWVGPSVVSNGFWQNVKFIDKESK